MDDLVDYIVGEVRGPSIKYGIKLQSKNNRDKVYEIICDKDNNWFCSCPDFIYRRKGKSRCKHIFSVIEFLDANKVHTM